MTVSQSATPYPRHSILGSARRGFALAALSALSACAPDATDEAADAVDQANESAYVASAIGFTTSNSCGNLENKKIKAAWNFLTEDLRGPLRAQFTNCVLSASLVEVSCDDQLNKQRLVDDVLADQIFQVECVDFKPGKDMDGNPTQVEADAHVGIRGTKMRVDKKFARTSKTASLAAVMAHEMMHNRGYRHKDNDFGSQLYPLTAPEQIHACVQDTQTGAGPNVAPPDHWDGALTCAPDNHWCDVNGCYKTTQTCLDGEYGNYCFITTTFEDGSPLPVSVPGYVDVSIGAG